MLCMLNTRPWAWMSRGHVIPAYAGIQIRGTTWIPAYVGMTTTRHAPSVDPNTLQEKVEALHACTRNCPHFCPVAYYGVLAGSAGSLPASSSSPSRGPSLSRSMPMRTPEPGGVQV